MNTRKEEIVAAITTIAEAASQDIEMMIDDYESPSSWGEPQFRSATTQQEKDDKRRADFWREAAIDEWSETDILSLLATAGISHLDADEMKLAKEVYIDVFLERA